MDKDQKVKVEGIFKNMPNQKELFMNNKGEFFTNENYCKNSVKKDSEYSKIERSQVLTDAAPEVEETEEEKAEKARLLAEKEAKAEERAKAEAKEKEEALKAVEGITTELLKAKGEDLKSFLEDMKRSHLDALDSLFEFSIPELPNKGECVKQIVEALTK